MLKTFLIILVVSVTAWALIMALLSALARRPAGLGARDGKLSPCPGTPNCVCSQDTPSPRHAIDPLTFDDGPDEAWERLKGILTAWPRTRIVTDGDSYLHAECASQVFRFVDDVECVLDRNAKVIHIRSASRAGRSDLGINRRRVEAIRQAFQER